MNVRTICSLLLAAATLAACSQRSAGSGDLPADPDVAIAPAAVRGATIEIVGIGKKQELDDMVVAFMKHYQVPNAQLAVSSHGRTVFSHAYTYLGLAESTTTRQTIMRIASDTKPWTSAAIYRLARDGKPPLDVNAAVFPYLGITQPLRPGTKVDPRIMTITIKNMIDYKSGWIWTNPRSGDDPAFKLREIAEYLQLRHAVDQTQYVRYQFRFPLQLDPGSRYAYSYCNYCYDVLGMVVAKASRTSFIQYLQTAIATPSGAGIVAISPTLNPRLQGEVANYFNDDVGLSAIFVTSNKLYPEPYSGDGGILEVSQGDGGMATSADSLLAFMNYYAVGRYGPAPSKPNADDYFAGEIAGTESYVRQLPNGTNYAFDVNTDFMSGRNPAAWGIIQDRIARYLSR